jgi:hypothetical protein
MTTKPFPDPADSSAAAVAGTKDAAAPLKRTSLLGSLNNQLPRVIGGAILLIYLIGLTEQLVNYKWGDSMAAFTLERWGDPAANYTLASQLLERMVVLLLGYALIFFPGLEIPGRKSGRVALKLASLSCLMAGLTQLALGGLCVNASLQLYRISLANLNIETRSQEATVRRVQNEAPTIGEGQLHLIYLDMVPNAKASGKTPAIEVMRSAVVEIAGHRIKDIQAASDSTHTQLVRQVVVAVAKYSAVALLGAVMFFLIWDQTPKMRAVEIFAPSADPNLVLATRMARRFRRLQLWGEKLFTPPDLENYRWYRHLRRWWQRRFKKKK